MPDVLDEVHSLAANGYQEVVLTGIHLSSYGSEPGHQPAGADQSRLSG